MTESPERLEVDDVLVDFDYLGGRKGHDWTGWDARMITAALLTIATHLAEIRNTLDERLGDD